MPLNHTTHLAIARGVLGVGLVALLLAPATVASAASRLRYAPSPAKVIRPGKAYFTEHPLFGATISSTADLATKTSQFGHLPIVRVYYPGLPSPNAWTSTGEAGANQSAIIVSFKAQPLDILSGSDDAALSQFFDDAPTGHAIYYSYYHEPEDNIAAGQFTLPDYLAAWAHVVTLADAAKNPELHSILILMAWDLDPASGRNWENYLPSGGIITTLGWDAYPPGGTGTPAPASFMQAAVTASQGAGLPFGFAEFGTTTVTGRGVWLTSVGTYIRTTGALFASLYDDSYAGGLGGGGTFYVSDPDSLHAWKVVIKHP
jgi:hypothetical protein